MKKYLKIFVVSLCLVSLLTLSCFATSAPSYGHYISAGDYMFNSTLDFDTPNLMLRFDFYNRGNLVRAVYFYPDDSGFYFTPTGSAADSYDVYRNGAWISESYRTFTIEEGFYIYDPLTYSFFISNTTKINAGYDSNLLDGFLSSFTMIGQWISGASSNLTTMFWNNNSLTFLGTLAVAGLALAVSFLIIGLIQRFLKFRG